MSIAYTPKTLLTTSKNLLTRLRKITLKLRMARSTRLYWDAILFVRIKKATGKSNRCAAESKH